MILYLFLKAKSQAKAYIIKTVVCCLRKRKDVKKTVKKKIGKSFLELTCFIFYLSFKPVVLRLCAFIVCCLFFIYGLWEADIEKYLLNSILFRLSKILEKYLWKYLLLRKLRAVGPLTLLILTLSQICFKNSAKITTLYFRKCLINVQLTKRMYH